MRIVLPNLEVVKVSAVEPIVEKAVTLNGEQEVYRAVYVGAEPPTGICFEIHSQNTFRSCNRKILCGNLPTEEVRKIVNDLAVKGYADLSQYEYQKLKIDLTQEDEPVIDGGKSKPYIMCGGEYVGIKVKGSSVFDDAPYFSFPCTLGDSPDVEEGSYAED